MFKKLGTRKQKVDARKNFESITPHAEIPDGMFIQCPHCDGSFQRVALIKNMMVCPDCGNHCRMHVVDRIVETFDAFDIFHHSMKTLDPLAFPGYLEKAEQLTKQLGVYDAVVCGEARMHDIDLIAVVMDTNFMMGSMGSVVGEKITRAFERAQKQKKPIVIFCASGGARMQEGVVSLMQMAKTSGAVESFNQSGGLYISVLTDPTTGGVTASFAMLADIIIAEPKVLIGFAGPRVIEQTMKERLPDTFQTAEFVEKKGFVDKVVHRHDMKETLYKLLKVHEVR